MKSVYVRLITRNVLHQQFISDGRVLPLLSYWIVHFQFKLIWRSVIRFADWGYISSKSGWPRFVFVIGFELELFW